VRLGQLVAPRRRPCEEARALELEQCSERVCAVGYEVGLMAMRERDARRAQPGRPEAEAQYGERLRVQAGGETAKVLAHDLERKPPNPRSGDGRVKPERGAYSTRPGVSCDLVASSVSTST
jgi:hypothetical protein